MNADLRHRGYGDPLYARSLGAFGEVDLLTGSRGYFLRRPTPALSLHDGISPYPQFACDDWAQLPDDLDKLGTELVSFAAVTDPFGGWDEQILGEAFPDKLMLFKEHFCVDLSVAERDRITEHHRRAARKAESALHVVECGAPLDWHETWCGLYAQLIARHQIIGMPAFSPEGFLHQLRIPGLRAFVALDGADAVGMTLWLERNGVYYYHLGAYSASGYEKRASYGIFAHALRRFAEEGRRWVSLGSGAGLRANTEDGLSRFKRGWATGVRPVWFGGRILDRSGYDALVRATRTVASTFFPAYRSGEFQTVREDTNG